MNTEGIKRMYQYEADSNKRPEAFHDSILFCIKNGFSIDFNIDFVILYHLR